MEKRMNNRDSHSGAKHPDCEDRCQLREHKGYISCSQTGECAYMTTDKTVTRESGLDYAIANFVRMPPGTVFTAAQVADVLTEMAEDCKQPAGPDDDDPHAKQDAWNAAISAALTCYSPDDSAGDWMSKIAALRLKPAKPDATSDCG